MLDLLAESSLRGECWFGFLLFFFFQLCENKGGRERDGAWLCPLLSSRVPVPAQATQSTWDLLEHQ